MGKRKRRKAAAAIYSDFVSVLGARDRSIGSVAYGDGDILQLMQTVMMECARTNADTLRDIMEELRSANKRKKALRRYIAALRELRVSVLSEARERGVDLCSKDKQSVLTKIFARNSHDYEVGEVERELCISDHVPRAGVDSLARLDAEIAKWEDDLDALADMTAVMQMRLQKYLDAYSKCFEMLSNILKKTSETGDAIMQNMK
jgi:nitrate reductase assembly molybdenum cofactor insertion protein NarJ